jgi:tRNA A-37 threonylcarbamoyl transferase component Bud32
MIPLRDTLDRLKAALVDRYTIEHELGRGGMATVYLARDLKHKRKVAIKVLHPELAVSLGAERFLREIHIAAQLTHPHILGLHDSGEADGMLYYVMPYVDGETVAQRVAREGPLPLVDVLGIATQVADALAYAHEQGVVHRDIKPANILWSRGHAVVADFGIARAVTVASEEGVTAAGLTMGTPAYMSPEQANGADQVDGRADVYSLGCVVYEMLVGHAPFSGATAYELLTRHAMDPVPSVRAARPDIPEAIEQAVTRALAKLPADRYATAARFAKGLMEVETAPTPSVVQAIPKKRDRFWTHPEGRYGAFHEADRNRVALSADLLVVFVHGIPGDRLSAWRDLPQMVLHEAGRDVDVLSFQYPAKLWHRTSIESAASHLRDALSGRYAHYGHLVLVGNGAGALVAKQALVDDFQELKAGFESLGQDIPTSECLAFRVRRVIHIAAQQDVGRRVLTAWTRAAYEVVSPLARPLAAIRNSLPGQHYRWGHNTIVSRLKENDPQRVALEREYDSMIRGCDALLLPRPVTIELVGAADRPIEGVDVLATGESNVDLEVRPDTATIRGATTSDAVKRPEKARHMPLAYEIGSHVRQFASQVDAAIARYTAERAYKLDRFDNVRTLVDEQVSPESHNGDAGGQAQVAERIIRSARSINPEPTSWLVTGETGVGKSIALRRVARVLGLQYLRGRAESSLPIGIILQQITLARSDVAEIVNAEDAGHCAWVKIASSWCAWADQLLDEEMAAAGWREEERATRGRINLPWLERRLAEHPTLLILDGLDEFITNHPGIALDHLRDLVSYLQSRFRHNGRLVIVAAARTGIRHLESLASTAAQVLVVPRLTEGQAAIMFPHAARFLDRATNDRSRALLLTPLILSELRPLAVKEVGTKLSGFDLTGIALNSILSRSGVANQRDMAGKRYPLEAWRAALAFLAWTFFRSNRGEAPVMSALAEALDASRTWRAAMVEADDTDAACFADASQILADRACCQFLVTRTVFYPTGQTSMRFRHRHWEDYLAALYLGWSVKHQNAVGLGQRAFTDTVCELSVDLLRDTSIDLAAVTRLVSATLETRNELIVGNFTALLGDSFLGVTEEAIGRGLLGRLAEFPPLAQYGIIGSLGYRAIRQTAHDPWAHVVRAAFRKYLADDGLARHIISRTPVLMSATWCYLELMRQRFQLDSPTTDWPGLRPADAEGLLYTRTDAGGVSNARQRSIQNAFVDYQLSLLEYPDKAVKAMHHLLIVVSAFVGGAADAEVEKALPQLISNSELESAVRRYSEVPALAQIWDICKAAVTTRR